MSLDMLQTLLHIDDGCVRCKVRDGCSVDLISDLHKAAERTPGERKREGVGCGKWPYDEVIALMHSWSGAGKR